MTSASGTHIQDNFITEKWWQAFLLLSGLSVVIYLMTWQRILFTTLGETLFTRNAYICIAFIGLALGGFLGGELSHRYPNHLPKIFFILQLVLGAYGLLSYPLVRAVGTALTRVSDSALPFLLFFLLMVPTMAMGGLVTFGAVHSPAQGDVGGVLSHAWFFLLGMALGTVLLIFILYFLFNCFVALFFASMFNALAAYLLFLKVNNKPLWGRRLS